MTIGGEDAATTQNIQNDGPGVTATARYFKFKIFDYSAVFLAAKGIPD